MLHLSSLANSPRGREFGRIGKTLFILHGRGARTWIIDVDSNDGQRSRPTSTDNGANDGTNASRPEQRRSQARDNRKDKARLHSGQNGDHDAPATDHEHDHVRGENEGTVKQGKRTRQ